MNINSDACVSAAISGSVFWYVSLVLNEFLFFDGELSSIFYGLLLTPFYFLIAYVFAFILLIPLSPIMDRTSRGFSFSVFVMIGFFVPVYLSTELIWLSERGLDPLSIDRINHTIFTGLSFGLIGVSSAIASWVTLKYGKSKANFSNKQMKREN